MIVTCGDIGALPPLPHLWLAYLDFWILDFGFAESAASILQASAQTAAFQNKHHIHEPQSIKHLSPRRINIRHCNCPEDHRLPVLALSTSFTANLLCQEQQYSILNRSTALSRPHITLHTPSTLPQWQSKRPKMRQQKIESSNTSTLTTKSPSPTTSNTTRNYPRGQHRSLSPAT